MSNFDTLLEAELERFQQGGFLVGDRVRFKTDALKHPYMASRGKSFQDIVRACMEPSFDLTLRIGAIKSIYPSTTPNHGIGTQAPDGIFFDIYIEYAPGLYRNPMTVPLEVLDIQDDGINRAPVPDSIRRPNNIHEPKEVKAKTDHQSEINLPSQNVKLPSSNKWDDTQPGGGNYKPKR
jgi:hypothetical protein